METMYFLLCLASVLVSVQQMVNGNIVRDMFDKGNNYTNNICFTHEDCHRSSEASGGSETLDPESLPLFCLTSDKCVCNKLQQHDHSTEMWRQIFAQCIQCTLNSNPSMDLCTVQDPFSYCNRTSALCECLPLAEQDYFEATQNDLDKAPSTALYRSICLHRHNTRINELRGRSEEQTIPGQISIYPSERLEGGEMFSGWLEWSLIILLAYVLPCLVVLLFSYCTYKQFCSRSAKTVVDGETIVYRKL